MQQGTRSRELLLIMLPTDIYLGVQCFHNLIQDIRFTAQSKGIADAGWKYHLFIRVGIT